MFQHPVDDAITDAAEKTLRISVLADKWGQEWTISVRDRGIGIDPSDADRRFRAFDRQRNVVADDGTEIGLALRRPIDGRRDGEIGVDSAPGEGSTFR